MMEYLYLSKAGDFNWGYIAFLINRVYSILINQFKASFV